MSLTERDYQLAEVPLPAAEDYAQAIAAVSTNLSLISENMGEAIRSEFLRYAPQGHNISQFAAQSDRVAFAVAPADYVPEDLLVLDRPAFSSLMYGLRSGFLVANAAHGGILDANEALEGAQLETSDKETARRKIIELTYAGYELMGEEGKRGLGAMMRRYESQSGWSRTAHYPLGFSTVIALAHQRHRNAIQEKDAEDAQIDIGGALIQLASPDAYDMLRSELDKAVAELAPESGEKS